MVNSKGKISKYNPETIRAFMNLYVKHLITIIVSEFIILAGKVKYLLYPLRGSWRSIIICIGRPRQHQTAFTFLT